MRRVSKSVAIAVSTLLLVSICSTQQTTPTAPASSERQGSPTPPPGPVLGGDGIPYYIPLWRTNNYLLSSVIYQNGSSIGIGTATPAATLDVNGGINTATTYEIWGDSVLSIGGHDSYNLFLGVGAGTSNLGEYNVFSGAYAGYGNTGLYNVFSGYAAGTSNNGSYNTFSGAGSGQQNSTGNYNTFSGARSGQQNSTGTYNTFSGYLSGNSNTAGYNNTFSGWAAGANNVTGGENTFSGAGAGAGNTTGLDNTFFGFDAGSGNTTGQGNTFSGAYSGETNTTGTYNTFYGYWAGENNATGNNNIYIGNLGSNSESNTLRIGGDIGNGYGPQTAAYIAGIYGVNVGGVPVQINSNGQLGAQTSSLRFKEQIQDMGDSTTALMKLRPVTFLYKPEYANGKRTLQYGLIAEEVAKIYPDLVTYDNEGQPYSVRYQYIATMLLNEVQKQYRRAETQAEVIKAQKEKINELEQRLSRLERIVSNQVQMVAQK